MNVTVFPSLLRRALLGTALLAAFASPGRAQTQTLRIAVSPIESAAEVYYAKDMGFFKKAGLDVTLQTLPGGSPATAAAIVANAVDIGYGVVDTLAALHQRNIPVVIIAPASEYLSSATSRVAVLVVAAGSTAQKASDLNGKTFVVGAINSLAETAPRVWIDRNGGDSTTIKFVEIPFPAIPAALAAGRIDGAWVPEPFIGAAVKNGRVLGYGMDGISRHFLMSGWFTAPQWLKDHPDLAGRFAAVMHETAVWANQNPTQSGEILAKELKIDPAIIATMVRSRYGEQLTPALAQPLIDIAAKYGNFSSFPARDLFSLP